jgi:hypothetical protein
LGQARTEAQSQSIKSDILNIDDDDNNDDDEKKLK